MPEKTEKDARCILLLCDNWSVTREGISAVNQSLALALSRYKGIRVYSTVFRPLATLSAEDRALADDNNITLISLASNDDSAQELYALFNESPIDFFEVVREKIPYVSHVVGHSPITAEAALKLRESAYPDSKVILFYHVVPRDVEWVSDKLPYVVPTDSEQVRLGEMADVVYSVTEKLHWYYTAKFRNRATVEVDHRLFLPQCPDQVFDLARNAPQGGASCEILTVGYENVAQAQWSGLDVCTCGVNKVALAAEEKSNEANEDVNPSDDNKAQGLSLSLKVNGIRQEKLALVKEHMDELVTSPNMTLTLSSETSMEGLLEDLASFSLCIVPSRAEPLGYMGLQALSAGIPTLISEDSCLASLVKRLTSEPESFLVPVTPTMSAVRQDGSMWRDRIQKVLADPEAAKARAKQLQMALRRDEATKETHDNFVSYCLGGIHLKHEIMQVNFQYRKDEEKELPVMRNFNRFLLATLKQCWRYKHHPLTQDDDLYQIIPGVDLPIKSLVDHVTNKIEENDRRIVGVDKETGSFIVYCPTPDALSDLWAMCDVINRSLYATLLSGQENPLLEKMKLKYASPRTIISGPEFLNYKREITRDLEIFEE